MIAMKAVRTAVVSLACALATIIWVSPARAHSVWYNHGLATTQVGVEPGRGPIFRKIWLAAIGPDKVSPGYRSCVSTALPAAGNATWEPIDRNVEPWSSIPGEIVKAGGSLTSAEISRRHATRLSSMDAVMKEADGIFRREMKAKGCSGAELTNTRLAVVNRVCAPWEKAACTGRVVENRTGYLSSARYGKVFEWMMSNGLRTENQWVVLDADGSPGGVIQPNDLTRPITAVPSDADVQRQFEAGVADLRKSDLRFLYIVPRAMRIDRAVALHLLDGVDAPSLAIAPLPDRGGKLGLVSDEVARSRIRDCVLYRGVRDPQETSACAGYALDAPSIQACLDGARCAPDFGASGLPGVLNLSDGASLASLAADNDLPRIWNTSLSFKAHEDLARTCGAANKTQVASTHCLLAAQLTPPQRATLECLKSNGYAKAAKACLPAALGDSAAVRAARCLADNYGPRSSALCLVADRSPEAAAAVACYERNRGDTAKAAACVAADKLPPDAQDAATCGASSQGDYKKLAGCFAAAQLEKKLGGDAGRLVGCAVGAGGDAIGTTACMAGANLSPEQQILLQCAAQSPDPATFAVCAGGQLSLREYAKCQGKKFAEGECFGPNNEIRKLSRQLGLGDITDNTVVGDIANRHLEVIKFQVGFAESALGSASQLGTDVLKGAENLAQAGGDLVSGTLNAGASAVAAVAAPIASILGF